MDHGDLHIDGQDLGPGTRPVSSDDEYEWFEIIGAADLPRLLALLWGAEDDNILNVLEDDWTGARSYNLEQLLRDTGFPLRRYVW